MALPQLPHIALNPLQQYHAAKVKKQKLTPFSNALGAGRSSATGPYAGSTAPAGSGGWNPSADPYMMGLTGQYNQDIAGLKGKSLEEKKRILLAFGSKELARSVLGNDPFVDTISDDPDKSTSVLGQLGYQYRQQQQGFNEASSANNLFYGGGRGVGLRDLAHQNLVNVAGATTTARGQLTAQDDVVAQAQRDWGQRLFQGQWDAYQRWLQNRGIGAAA